MRNDDDGLEKTIAVTDVTLRAFFADSVSTAIRNQHVRTIEVAELYLVDLLIDFARAEALHQQGAEADEPLALMLSRATNAPRAERVHLLRQMGDRALFLSGYFADRVARGAVGIGYYIAMGEGAYASVSGLVRDWSKNGSSASALFNELAEKFARFVDVLNEVSDRTLAKSPVSVLKLYERWLRTRSPELARRMQSEEGASPIVLGLAGGLRG